MAKLILSIVAVVLRFVPFSRTTPMMSILALVAFGFVTARAQSPEVLYSVADTDPSAPNLAWSLIRIDPKTGVAEVVGLIHQLGGPSFNFVNSMDFDPDGNLLAMARDAATPSDAYLITIDPRSATVTKKLSVRILTNNIPFPAFASDFTGALFAVDVDLDILVSVNGINGTDVPIGSGLGVGVKIGSTGMDFDSNDDLYLLSVTSTLLPKFGVTPALYLVNKVDGTVNTTVPFTVDFLTGAGPQDVTGKTLGLTDVCFGAADTLFAASYINNIPYLLTIDTATGVGTVVAVITLAGGVGGLPMLPALACAPQPDHLECYRIRDRELKARGFSAEIELDSPQFGLTPECRILHAYKLCVPAVKKVSLVKIDGAKPAPFIPLPVGGQPLLTDFICYRLRNRACRATVPHPRQQVVQDQFASRTVRIHRPFEICTPAIKVACDQTFPRCNGQCPSGRFPFCVQQSSSGDCLCDACVCQTSGLSCDTGCADCTCI